MICLHEVELLLHVDLGDPLEHGHQVEVVAGLGGGAVGAEADAQVSGKKGGIKSMDLGRLDQRYFILQINLTHNIIPRQQRPSVVFFNP